MLVFTCLPQGINQISLLFTMNTGMLLAISRTADLI